MNINQHENWEYVSDTPQEFEEAIKNAVSKKEREFLKKMRYKILNEPAASNEILLDGSESNGIYLLRVSDDFVIGQISRDSHSPATQSSSEYNGLFVLLSQDMYPYLDRHISVKEWLRERDYKGIQYDHNNDLL